MSKLKKYKDRKGNSTAHLYRDEETEIFYAVLRVGRKIEKQSLGTKDYFEALRVLPNVLVELGKPLDERAKKKAANKLCADFWQDLRNKKVAEEIRGSTLKKFDEIGRLHILPYIGNMRPDQITRGLATDFILWHREEFGNQQLVNPFKYLGNLLNFMFDAGAINRDQMPELELPKSEKRQHAKKKGRILTDEERKAIRSHGDDRIKLIIGLADVLGMRKMEIGALEKTRIRKEHGRYMIHLEEDDTKTGLPRVLGVPKSLETLLENQIDESGASEYLFPTRDGKKHLPPPLIDRDWIAVKEAAGIVGRLRFHDLRHSRATEFAKQKVNPALACTILGMTLATYQKKYLNLSGSDLLETIDAIDRASCPK